ncbi:MAG: hypothetical protein DI588_16550 [Flavobacterium johnsoniae]|nr:MAG: hypothetical protein DI588_16550 [Flavobacterium johnsoniae]
MKFFSPFIVLICLISCLKKTSQDQYLEVFFLKEGLRSPMAINCNALQGSILDVNYKKIEDKKVFETFKEELKKLVNAKEQRDIDVRIQVVYHDKKIVDTICMGAYFDIKVNGINKEDSKKLLKTIKDEIYKY